MSLRPSSRKALAAVWAVDSASHTAHLTTMQGFARWPALIATQTAASALRLEGVFAVVGIYHCERRSCISGTGRD